MCTVVCQCGGLRLLERLNNQRLGEISTDAFLSFRDVPNMNKKTDSCFARVGLGGLCALLSVSAQAADISQAAVPLGQGVAQPAASPLVVEPYKYVAPPNALNDAAAKALQAAQDKRSAAAKRLVQLNAAGDYPGLASDGWAVMATEKLDDELLLMVGNSLAWTGRLEEGIFVYRQLAKSAYANEASVGLANVYRWQGKDELAMPLYKTALAANPNNADALEGMRLAERELAPRTTFSVGASKDNGDIQRRSASINHRWRDASGTRITELEIGAVRDSLRDSSATEQALTARYQDKNLFLKPTFELSTPTAADARLFGGVKLQLADGPVVLDVGRVNWGLIATNPNALNAQLSAAHVGLSAAQTFSLGALRVNSEFYDISDGNQIIASNLTFTPAWRPLGQHFKPYFGIESRAADFNTPNYWSPAQGSATLYGGVMAEWSAADWNLYASGQLGKRLSGEAGKSWSLSAGGKRWLARDISLNIGLWAMASMRDGSAYRAQSATVGVEKLWR